MQKILSFIIAAVLSAGAVAADSQKPTPEKSAVKFEKRSKKTSICPTCGKPESKCECEEDDKKHEEHEKTDKGETKTK